MNLFDRPWVCKIAGTHKPDPATLMYRETDPGFPCPNPGDYRRIEWDREHHHERYAKCIRCDDEISYARWFDWWGEKARFKGVREWLDAKDADKIEPCASNPNYYDIIKNRPL